MKLYKSFDDIYNQQADIVNFFEAKTEFLAHTHPKKDFETLHQHIIEVTKYFLNLINIHQLEPIIDKVIWKITSNKNP